MLNYKKRSDSISNKKIFFIHWVCTRMLIVFAIFIIYCMIFSKIEAQTIVYQTWSPWEIDSVLAAWSIKRYVNNDALFVSIPRGSKTLPDSSIDVPDSPYRRSARKTAFDEVVRLHNIDSACIKKILPIVRLLELAPWRKSEDKNAEAFEYGLRPLLPIVPVEGGLEKAFEYIDNFCQQQNLK